MQLVPFEAHHYVTLASKAGTRALVGMRACDMLAQFHQDHGIAFSALDKDGNLCGAAGITSPWAGLGEAWTLLTPEVKASSFFLHRKVVRIMKGIIHNNGFHRVQSQVQLSDPVAVAWILRLGFHQEASLEKYSTTREDYGLFVLFPKGK
jgi:hypothetical protein